MNVISSSSGGSRWSGWFTPIVAAAAILHLTGSSAVAQDQELQVRRENMPRVALNQLVYQDGDPVSATVTFVQEIDVEESFLALSFGTENSGEVEIVALKPTTNPLVYITDSDLVIKESAVVQANGVIELAPNEVFTAILSYKLSKRTKTPGVRAFSSDWGILADSGFSDSSVELRPGLALTADELNRPTALPPLGTLFVEGEVGAVQIASKRLMFLPENETQLAEFINRTGAQVLSYEGAPGPIQDPKDFPPDGSAWLLVEISGDPAKISQLPQLRALMDDHAKLSASNEATLALIATAMELWCEGYQVGLNPRMQMHGDLYWPEGRTRFPGEAPSGERSDSFGNIGSANPNVFSDSRFGIRQSWAFLAMFDFDRATIPVGVIDSGFAPNPDFKTTSPLYAERNLATGASGIGSAQTPQEVGNSGFGGKTWHGNGTVTTISGVPHNRFGTAGIGGQVAVPKLYHMGLGNFAFGFGSAIRLAVDDGCSVINISAGYPCRILSVLGNDDICSPDGRAVFALKLGLAVRAAAAATCAAAPLLDAFLPGLGVATCATAIGAAETAAFGLFATVFIGETRTPVERGVAYATAHGVPVVASAGNRISPEAMGALAAFVDTDNSNIDDWQVIPAVIPEVIAVGCCASGGWDLWTGDGNNHYANIQFWGDSIDIWAPYKTWYWAPEDGSVDPSSVDIADHITRQFGGTSNSAPIISGVICNLMAINPALDRRFAAPGTLSGLPARIRDILVNTAHQAGDPAAPDSADDVITYEWNPDTEMRDAIEEPAELLEQMLRRRNYLNAWAAVQQVATSVGVMDYPAMAYETDLGRDDRLADVSAPDGVRLPLRSAPFQEIEELSGGDQEFWFFRTPSANNLYVVRYEITMPASEDANSILINGRPGVFHSRAGEEQTIAWESHPLWRNAYFPTTISTRWGADSIYKLTASSTTLPLPPPDHHDVGSFSNETLDQASPRSNWISVPARELLEVEAYELNDTGLNFHHEGDIDVIRINFPTPPLTIPTSCGSLDPWISVRISPPNSNLRLKVFSRSGGSDTLLARGNGSDTVRLDCRNYLGYLPLYVMIENPNGIFAEYDLNLRWSIPDQQLGDRLDRIREANAGGRELPFEENFFRPPVPWLFVSPGLLPDSLVNPNPAAVQELDAEGRYLASRLFFVEVSPNNNLEIEFYATLGSGQSLRMELVGIHEQVLGSTSTPDLPGAPKSPKAPPSQTGDSQSLALRFNSLAAGVYILRLSGYRPGDQIGLYLSGNLNAPGGLSIEALLDQKGQYSPVPMGLPPELLDSSQFASTALFPVLKPEQIRFRRALELQFSADKYQAYQLESRVADGVWKASGSPIVTEQSATVSVLLAQPDADGEFRIRKLGDGGSFPPDSLLPAYHLLFQSNDGISYTLTGSTSLAPSAFESFGNSPDFTGDGSLIEWFYRSQELPPAPYFFRIED